MACHPTIPIAGIERGTFCEIAKPLSYSSRDTPETRAEILKHNCVGHRLCGWPIGAELAEICMQPGELRSPINQRAAKPPEGTV